MQILINYNYTFEEDNLIFERFIQIHIQMNDSNEPMDFSDLERLLRAQMGSDFESEMNLLSEVDKFIQNHGKEEVVEALAVNDGWYIAASVVQGFSCISPAMLMEMDATKKGEGKLTKALITTMMKDYPYCKGCRRVMEAFIENNWKNLK